MRYYKKILGLGDSFSNLVIQGDLGLASLRSMRLVTMVRYWVRIPGMQRFTVAKAAYLEALRQKNKAGWPVEIKDILDKCGLGEWWNKGKGIMGMEEIVIMEVQERLKNQKIQIWWASLDRSGSLKLYRQIKGSWGGGYFGRLG